MDYKGATGVRARSDLSPNARGVATAPLTDADLVKCAEWLLCRIQDVEAGREKAVIIPTQFSRRLVDVLLEVVNRGGR